MYESLHCNRKIILNDCKVPFYLLVPFQHEEANSNNIFFKKKRHKKVQVRVSIIWDHKTCGTRIHSCRMRTARFLPYRGVSLTQTPLDRDPPPTETPRQRSPWIDPPDRDPSETPPPRGQINTCENITFANLVCGR